MAWVYILISDQNGKFYIGASRNVDERLIWHNSILKNTGHSRKGIPWKIFLTLECDNMNHALKVEKHIKKMKSRKFIFDIEKFPDLRKRVIEKYRS